MFKFQTGQIPNASWQLEYKPIYLQNKLRWPNFPLHTRPSNNSWVIYGCLKTLVVVRLRPKASIIASQTKHSNIKNSLAGPTTKEKDSLLSYLARILLEANCIHTSTLLDDYIPQIHWAYISNNFKYTKLHIQTFMKMWI